MTDYRQIKFPKKMKVESPEIDSINKTTQRISNWLHRDFKEIIKPLQVLFELKTILENFQKNVVRQFQLLFRNQIEADVLSRQANIRASHEKIKLTDQHITKKKKQLDEAKERIIARYENTSKKLEEQHSKYLRRLDSHTYEITENIYPKQIKEKFSFTSIPSQQLLVTHTIEAARGRASCLDQGYLKAKQNVEKFILQREAFYDEISSMTTDMVSEGKYEVPFWFLEVEEIETKERRIEVFFEWKKSESKSSLNNEVTSELYNLAKNMVKEISHEKMPKADIEALNSRLEKLSVLPKEQIKDFISDCKNIFIG